MAAAARVRDRAGVQQVESSVECHNLGGPAQPDAQGLPGGAYRVAAMAVCLLLSACAPFGGPAGRDATDASAGLPSFYGTHFERSPSVEDLTRLGRRLFADTSLSASGALACASCHDPARAYGPPGKAAVMQGGADMASPGVRAVPSLTYQQATPPFTEHFTETEGDDSIDQGPAGGHGWDGRASSAHDQAAFPLLSPFEMANASPEAAIGRLRQSPNAQLFRATFGDHVLDDPRLSWTALRLALEVFQQSPADFYPYTSKYDASLRGEVALSASERRGLELFDDPDKGNCAACHPSAIKRGQFPQFTDYGFIALGVPRNAEIPANRDATYFDLGLCGPYRTDVSGQAEYCGLFKTPSLRNVALRETFFHNGEFHTLEDAVRFYVKRDLEPERFYPRNPDGTVRKFDDLPAAYQSHVNTDPPFQTSDRQPALNDAEIADVVTFLRTLTDGYRAPHR
jgi:cytochrome c peroxidase